MLLGTRSLKRGVYGLPPWRSAMGGSASLGCRLDSFGMSPRLLAAYERAIVRHGNRFGKKYRLGRYGASTQTGIGEIFVVVPEPGLRCGRCMACYTPDGMTPLEYVQRSMEQARALHGFTGYEDRLLAVSRYVLQSFASRPGEDGALAREVLNAEW